MRERDSDQPLSPSAEDVLGRISEQICEGHEPPWDDFISDHPELSNAIERLRRVHEIEAAFRRSRPISEQPPDPPATPPDEPARAWGPLQLLHPVGQGSFGTVWRAHDPLLERDVALKLAATVGERRQQHILEEGRRLARIDHPAVVRVHGAAVHDGRPGIWMDLAEGRTLEERLEQDGRFAEDEVVAVGVRLCEALVAVHAAGVVHGDVKAANVLRRDGGDLLLADFGSALVDPDETSLPGSASPIYAAPEILRGAASDHRDDVYSLGVLLYHLLTGAFPVAGDSQTELIAAHDGGQIQAIRTLRPEVSPALTQVIERALEPREARWPSMIDFERALRVATPAGTAKRRRLGPVAALVVLAVGAGATGLWFGTREETLGKRQPTSVATEPPPATGGVEALTASLPEISANTSAGVPNKDPSSDTSKEVLDRLRFDFYRRDRSQALAPGDAIRVGDALHLRVVRPNEPVWVYVVNQDANGDAYVLFPLDGVEPSNPLGPGTHRLPGALDGVAQDWVVTSDGGSESFLVIASRRPLRAVEEQLDRILVASSTRTPTSGDVTMRGVGGLGPAPEDAANAPDLLRELLSRAEAEAPGATRGRILTLRGGS